MFTTFICNQQIYNIINSCRRFILILFFKQIKILYIYCRFPQLCLSILILNFQYSRLNLFCSVSIRNCDTFCSRCFQIRSFDKNIINLIFILFNYTFFKYLLLTFLSFSFRITRNSFCILLLLHLILFCFSCQILVLFFQRLLPCISNRCLIFTSFSRLSRSILFCICNFYRKTTCNHTGYH